MSILKAEEIRGKSSEELDLTLETLRAEVFKLRGQSLDQSQKIHLIGQKRKEIARILTVKRERELAS